MRKVIKREGRRGGEGKENERKEVKVSKEKGKNKNGKQDEFMCTNLCNDEQF